MADKNTASLKLEFPNYNLEYEVKYLTDQATIDSVLEDIKAASPFIDHPVERDERVNVYYDTKKAFHLYTQGYECRGRDSKKGYKYDLKTPHALKGRNLGPDENGIFARREYCYRSSNNDPDLSKFSRGSISPYLESLEGKDLVPWVQGFFKRSRLTFHPQGFPDTELEIAFESGYYETIDGAARSEPLYIIELELKHGQYEALAQTAVALQEKYGLEVCIKTKGEMGMEFVAPHLEAERAQKFAEAAKLRQEKYPERPAP